MVYYTRATLVILALCLNHIASTLGDFGDIPCGPALYCYPRRNDTWIMGTTEFLVWYDKYPTLPAKNLVDIKLYEMTNTREPLKSWLGYNNEGFLPITLTSDYFQRVEGLPPNTISKRWYKFVVSPAGGSLAQDGPIFQIADIPRNYSTTVSVTATQHSETVFSEHPSMPDNYSLGQAVGIIIGSILGAILLGGTLVYILGCGRVEQRTLSEKGMNLDIHQRSSHAKLLKDGGLNTDNSVSQSPPFTENEAYLIANTYRESLRKPGWEDSMDQTAL